MKNLFRNSLMTFALALAITARGQQTPTYVEGDLLVMLEPGASPANVVQDLSEVDGRATSLQVVREVSAPMRTWLLHFDPAAVPQQLMRRLVGLHSAVRFAQNNHLVKERAAPDDDQYGQQWHHQNIGSEAAWDITTGGITATGDTIVVCIIENADLPHPDLVGNAWYNHAEVPDNNVDDDGNGYVDDFQGWNPGNNSDNVYGGGHGTQVAGMIGAKGNNGSQVAGANWDVKMMVVDYASTQEAAVLAAYTYPLVMRRLYNGTNGAEGAFVVATNASWGIDNADPADYPIWCAMYDTLGTAGILNCGATANNNVDIDQVGDMPTACSSDFMVSVTATNENDQRTFSGYGATTVDLGAPGEDVVTTSIGGGVGSTSGTSFASPLTAGVIGLLYSAPCTSLMSLVQGDPQAGALYVRQALFNGVEQVGNLPGNCVTGGRVNSYNSLVWIMSNCGSCPAPYNLAADLPAIGEADLSWSSTATDVFTVRYRPVGAADWTVVDPVSGTSLQLSGLNACAPYEFQVAAACDTSSSDFGPSFLFTSEGCCVAPAELLATAVDSAQVALSWTTVLAGTSYDIRYCVEGTGNWTVITGITGLGSTIDGLQGCTTYEVQARTSCLGGLAEWGTSTVVNTPGCGQCVDGGFCPSAGADSGSEWIDRIVLNTIDNTSGNNDGYAAFTDQGTTLIAGQSYAVTLDPGFSFFPYQENWSIWIDLDNNGQFEAPAELIYAPAESANTINGTLTIPATAAPGASRLRVIMKFQNPVADGCEDDYDYGETEDYCVTIEAANSMAETPSSVVAAYPNPADDMIRIALGSDNGPLFVMDNTGRTVLRTAYNGGMAIVPTAGLAEGRYTFLAVTPDGGRMRGSFLVVHGR